MEKKQEPLLKDLNQAECKEQDGKESAEMRAKAAQREKYMSEEQKENKVEKVMSEFKHGTLHSGSKEGPKVTDPAQAKAIAMKQSEQSYHNRK